MSGKSSFVQIDVICIAVKYIYRYMVIGNLGKVHNTCGCHTAYTAASLSSDDFCLMTQDIWHRHIWLLKKKLSTAEKWKIILLT